MKALKTLVFLIALMLFFNSESLGQMSLNNGVENLANQINSSIQQEQKKKVAIVPFRDISGQQETIFSRYIAEELTTALSRIGKLEFFERELLDKVFAELKRGETGIIDPKTTKELGKIAGVDAIVTGTITELQTYVSVNCRIIDTETGKIFLAASVEIVIDENVRKLLNSPTPSTSVTGALQTRQINLKQTLYFGADWLTVILNSAEVVDGRFIQFNFMFINPFEEDATISLDRPEENVYIVDNLGNSYDFVSSQGIQAKGNHRLRPNTRIKISVVIEAHKKPARYITLRTKWRASGHRFRGTKEFVIKNIAIRGL